MSRNTVFLGRKTADMVFRGGGSNSSSTIFLREFKRRLAMPPCLFPAAQPAVSWL